MTRKPPDKLLEMLLKLNYLGKFPQYLELLGKILSREAFTTVLVG